MKKSLPPFLAGVLTTVLVVALALPALAAVITARTAIEVDPVNILVNGETFVPHDVNGNEVAVFAYNGTTYAPLRALAEAYGLEVGYDAEKNMATVGKVGAPAKTAQVNDEEYEAFKAMWEITFNKSGDKKYSLNGKISSDIPWEQYTLSTALPYIEVIDIIDNAEKTGILHKLASELVSGDLVKEIDLCFQSSGLVTTRIIIL